MEQNRPKQTDQQATNAALAALAAAGNAFALGQLWEVNKGFVRRQLWQWYEKNQTVADSAGLSFEDLVQEGYFATLMILSPFSENILYFDSRSIDSRSISSGATGFFFLKSAIG